MTRKNEDGRTRSWVQGTTTLLQRAGPGRGGPGLRRPSRAGPPRLPAPGPGWASLNAACALGLRLATLHERRGAEGLLAGEPGRRVARHGHRQRWGTEHPLTAVQVRPGDAARLSLGDNTLLTGPARNLLPPPLCLRHHSKTQGHTPKTSVLRGEEERTLESVGMGKGQGLRIALRAPHSETLP